MKTTKQLNDKLSNIADELGTPRFSISDNANQANVNTVAILQALDRISDQLEQLIDLQTKGLDILQAKLWF